MKQIVSLKIRYIFLPFLAITAGFMPVYTLLDWWLVIRPHSLWIREDIAYIGGPLVLSGIVGWIGLWPRIKNLLRIKRRREFSKTLLIAAAFTIGTETGLLQSYLAAVTEGAPLNGREFIRFLAAVGSVTCFVCCYCCSLPWTGGRCGRWDDDC